MTSPINPKDRAVVLDVLRGFALLGIFLGNIFNFSGYGFMEREQLLLFNTSSVDFVLGLLKVVLVDGKFYSIFSLLFGIGFSVVLMKGKQKSEAALKLFYRRLTVLMLIGGLHLYFLWDGDILFLYAVLGLFLPLFRNSSNGTLLGWALVFILSPIAIDFLKVAVQGSPAQFLRPITEAIDSKNGLTQENWRTFLFTPGEGLQHWQAWQESGWAYRFGYLIDSNRLMKVFGLFLLGFYAGRTMIYSQLMVNLTLLRRVTYWGFALGIPANLAMFYFENDEHSVFTSFWGLADTISYAVGVVPLALAYASGISLLYLKKPGLLTLVAPVGRMALTTYLSQTVLSILIFYSVGLGLGQKFGLLWLYVLVIVIYSAQVMFANWWLTRFEFGPVEWLWRQMTYGKRLPIVRVQHEKLATESNNLVLEPKGSLARTIVIRQNTEDTV